jgi:hypothetical protein
MGYLDLNVVYVGYEDFAQGDYNKVGYAIDKYLPSIYGKVGLRLGAVSYYAISNWQWSSSIDESDTEALTDRYTVPDSGVDVFVVRTLHGAEGVSEQNGSCDKNSSSGRTGVVVSLQGDCHNVGNTFAHEIGHYLGLEHCDEEGNFMYPSSNSYDGIYTWQGEKMNQHCFVYG